MRPSILLLAATTALTLGCNSSSSPLIGTWVNTENNGCATTVTFSSDTWTSHNPAVGSGRAYDSASPVKYSVSQSNPNIVFVTGQSGTDTWVLTDANHATAGTCHYARQ